MIIRNFRIIPFLTICLLLIGLQLNACSSGGESPIQISPNEPDTGPHTFSGSLPVAQTGSLPDGRLIESGVFDLYEVSIDVENQTGEITPFRQSAAVKDSFIVDISDFLTISPCTDCLKLASIALDANQNLELTFTLRHPFKPGNLGSPPSSTNRLDLHIFDVFGVVHFKGPAGSVGTKSVATLKLLDPDGFTDRFDSRIDEIYPTDANLHPYLVMSLDPTNGNFNPSSPTGFSDVTSPTGHNVLPMGCSPKATTFRIDTNNETDISFALVITASYGQSAVKSTMLVPTYYLPEFNRKEAWRVSATIEDNAMFEGQTSSYCQFQIKVWDWNHGGTVDPDMVSKSSIKSPSDVSSVTVFIPGVTSTSVNAIGPLSGDGTTIPLIYIATVYNQMGASRGPRPALIKVTDSRQPGLNTGGVGDAVARDGITFFELNEFATYQLLDFNVLIPATVAVITTIPDPPVVFSADTVTLNGESSYAYMAEIISWEWDLDYDGVTFNVDRTGAVLDDVTFRNPYKDRLFDVTVGLRVTDNATPTPGSGIATKVITVRENRAPAALFSIDIGPQVRTGDRVHFDGATSKDPDSDPITLEWDFDYQPGNFTAEASGVTASKFYDTMGMFVAALQVCDNALPSPNCKIFTIPIVVTPLFKAPVKIEDMLYSREFPPDTHNHVIVTDPNTDDIYVGYTGNFSSNTAYERMRVQRSNDNGTTWSAPMVPKDDNYATGDWGFTMCLIPNSVPGRLYVFWISEGGNQNSPTQDRNNILCTRGTPSATDLTINFQTTTHQDITHWYLYGAGGYPADYWLYSDPTDIVVATDPYALDVLYIAYVEEAPSGGGANRSIRLIKTTNITAYPNAQFLPIPSATEHIDVTATTSNFDSVDIAVDTSHNVYIVWDDNGSNAIEIRKIPFGTAPANPIQTVAQSTSNTLSSPAIAIAKDGSPVVVYNDTAFPGGTLARNDVILSYGINATPVMSQPMRVNNSASGSSHQYKPAIGIDKDSGMIFVFYEDRRDNASYGEIYWNILDENYDIILDDTRINVPNAIADFDVHAGVYHKAGNVNLAITWEQYSEDTWIAIAY